MDKPHDMPLATLELAHLRAELFDVLAARQGEARGMDGAHPQREE